jgi:hypothetical protein
MAERHDASICLLIDWVSEAAPYQLDGCDDFLDIRLVAILAEAARDLVGADDQDGRQRTPDFASLTGSADEQRLDNTKQGGGPLRQGWDIEAARGELVGLVADRTRAPTRAIAPTSEPASPSSRWLPACPAGHSHTHPGPARLVQVGACDLPTGRNGTGIVTLRPGRLPRSMNDCREEPRPASLGRNR